MSSTERQRIKSFIERKNEEALLLLRKEQQIKEHLKTIKNNAKFIKGLNLTLITLENLISKDNSDYFINIHSIIKLKGIKTLCNIASVNINNEEIIEKVTLILKNMIKNDNTKTYDLSKFFLENNGQDDIFQLLINLKNKNGIGNLLEIIYILIPIPQFFNILLESEMIDTIKFLIEFNENNLEIHNFLFKIILKITNHKKGRDLLINTEFTKKIISYIEMNIKNKNSEAVLDGLIIIDNILKKDDGKTIIKKINAFKIAGDGSSTFFDNEQITNMLNKINIKLTSIEDIKEKVKMIKQYLKEEINIIKNINELNDLFNYVSNFILVEDFDKIIFTEENINLIVKLFSYLYSVDLNKNNEYNLIDYISLMKFIIIIFKNMLNINSEFINEENYKIIILLNNKTKIFDCIKKIYEAIIKNNDKYQKKEIKIAFNSFFAEYCDILFKLINLTKNKNNEKSKEILPVLKYILEKIIANSNESFYKDERINYYFSFILKKILEYNELHENLIQCFSYLKNIINNNQNKKTLSNIFDIIYFIIKNKPLESETIKQDFIQTIINFMKEKPNFRYPNLINLKILDILLNQDNKEDINCDNIKDFIYSICTVMVKGYQPLYVQDIEKKILLEGSNLLQKLISVEYFKERLQEFDEMIKIYSSKLSQEDIEKLKDNLIFQISALNINEFLVKGSKHVLNNIKELIKKEINYIENYKKEKSKDKEINISYNDILSKSTSLLNLFLHVLRKVEDNIIIIFNKNKEEKFIDILKIIIELNLDIIETSSDIFNLINHLRQLRKNALFLINNENIFKSKEKAIYDQYINSLINLLRKNIYNEQLCLEIIKTFSSFANYNKDICSLLIKKGFIKLVFQFLNNTNNSQLVSESIQLIKNICFSSQKNLITLANQNILNILFEIHIKFINENKIINNIDLIVNEIKKLPGQGVHIEDILLNAIKNFNQNIKNNFNNNDVKFKLLNDLIIINSYNKNKFQIQKLISNKDFINNFISLLNKTLNEKKFSQIIDKLFTNEIELIKKIIYQIPLNNKNEKDENDILIQNFCDILLLILFHESIFQENFLLSCTTLLYYIKNDFVYSKFLSHKIDKTFIEKILELEENYSDNLQISKVVNKIISYLSLKNANFASYIIKKGGFANIIEDLKTLINLNDNKSKLMKYKSLIMIESLLNDENNMNIFIQCKGFEVINNIIKNEVNLNKEQNNVLIEQFICLCCINCDDGYSKDKKDYKIKDDVINNDIIITDNYLRSSTKIINIKQQNLENEDYLEKDNNYILYCMKIINKCLIKNKKEFLQKSLIDNLIKVSEDNFPDKNIFLELIDILNFLLKDLEQNLNNKNNDFEQNKDILKILLAIKAYFYSSEKLTQKINELVIKICDLLFNKDEYASEIKKVLIDKYENKYILKFKVFTYLSLVIDFPLFKNVVNKIKNEIISFFNDILLIIKIIHQKREDNNISNFFNINKEGIILSLIKLYNYFINNNIINNNEKEISENINYIEKISIELYIPNNYNFIYAYEKELSKIINDSKYKNNYLLHLKYVLYKLISFIKDFSEELKYISLNDEQNIIEKKLLNLENILNLSKQYYKKTEDKNIKEESCLKIFESLIGLLELLFDDNINDNYINNKNITNIINLIWKIIFNCLKLDLNNKKAIFKKIFNYNIFQKLTKTINNNLSNKPSLRKIPLILSEKNEINNELNELLFQFINNDIKTHAKTNEKIKKYDIKTLSNIIKNFSFAKLLLQDKILLQILKDEYTKQNASNGERLILAILFKNLTKNNINLDNNIVQIIISKVLKNPIETLENEGRIIAETEIESVINIMKNKNLFGRIIKKNLINSDDLKKIETIYDNLDINICKQLKNILRENEIDNKIKQSLKSVNEDEQNLDEMEKTVKLNYEKHASEYSKFFERIKKEELVLNTIKDELLINGKKRILSTKDIKKQNKLKEKIKTPLSMIYNQKIYICINEILLILIKNFNLVSTNKDDQYNSRRIKIINKSFELLQLLSLTKDNHLSILEEGFLNLLDKIKDEYNSIQINKENINEEYNKFIFDSLIKAKFILKECSTYDCANELILDSPLFSDIISEIMNFNITNNSINKTNGNLRKNFIYNIAIIANIFSVNKFHEQILDKLDMNIILDLGMKIGNVVILENTIDLIMLYLNKNKNEISNEINNKIFALIEKYIKNKNSSSALLTKINQLIPILFTTGDNIKTIEDMKLIESINIGIKKYFYDSEYIYSVLNCLVIIIKDNLKLTEDCFKSEIINNIKTTINNYAIEMPPNYTLIIWKVTKLYYLLLKNKQEMIKKMCELGITLNIVNYLDIYNNKVMPKSEQEKTLNILLKINQNNNIIKKNYVSEILMNCINYLNIISTLTEGNDYLTSNTSFNKYILLSLENENNDNIFLTIALQCLSNYLKAESSQMFLKTNIVDIYHLITNLQYKYYSDSEILINMNNICDTVINCNKIEKNYVKKFLEILTESIKFKEIDLDLIKLSLKIIKNSLEKNNFLIDSINVQFISNVINIIKRYKDNNEIQYYCYNIILFIMDDTHISAFSNIIRELLIQIKQSVTEFNYDNSNKKIKEQIKEYITSIIIFLFNSKSFTDLIITELLIPFIQELKELNIKEESKLPFILNIFYELLKTKDKNYMDQFINNNGIDKLLSILKTADKNITNVKTIIKIFDILKYILKSDDEYKIKMQELKVPELINNLIKLKIDNKVKSEGQSVLFLINKANIQLEKVEEVDYITINYNEKISSAAKNFLTSGKQVKIINEKGEIKEKQLFFNQDLTKVQAKSIKSNLPPKSKYVIEINKITSIIKGHGTKAFKKVGGLFKSVPKAENCFSILGNLNENGVPKSINVVCNSEKDVDRWIQYMENVINYFKKKKLVGMVNIIKETKY